MKRAAVAVVLLALFAGGYALGQSQGWSADQDGSQFKLYDVQSVNVNGGLANVDSCLVSPDSILFTPVLSSADVTITRAAQNGSGAMKIINGNQAGFVDLGVEQTLLRMTAQGLDNGGVNFDGATYFGVRSDTTASYPGDRDYQQVYFAPRSIYEVTGSVVTPPLNGTTLLSPYYFRGETIGLDGTAGNNTRPDGISLGFFWDQPSLVALHGFTANSYQTGEIFGPPCSGATCYGLRIYGGSSDNSERVAGTYVADGLGGSGTRCVQVDNSGVMSIAASACGSGAGTVTAVSATAPLFITGGASPTPNVVGHDLIYGGASTTAGQNLGSISTAPLGCVTSGGDCVVDGLTLAGGLHFDTGTGTETLDSFTCGAGTFVNSSSTSGLACTTPAYPVSSVTGANGVTCSPTTGAVGCTLANATCGANTFVSSASSGSGLVCTQPAFSNLSGSLSCGQTPAYTGSATKAAGSCATKVVALDSGGSNLPIGGSFTSGQVLYDAAGTIITVDPTTLIVACKINWYAEVTASIATNAWVPTSSMTTFTTNVAELPCDHKATAGTLYVNVVGNGLVSGSVQLSVTRNSSVIAASAITVTTLTAAGVQSAAFSTSSGSANDTYGVFYNGLSGSAVGNLNFSAEVVLN